MGRSVPSLGKAASASQASLALAAMGGAVSARALQAVAGVRGSGGTGPGSVGSAGAIGDATDAPRGKAGPATGNRPGFASVLARIATSSRASRSQSDARDAIVAGLSAQPTASMSNALDPGVVEGGAVAAPASPAGRPAPLPSLRREAAAAMRAVSRLARALDRARPADPPGGSNPVAGAAMRPVDATPATPQASGREGGDEGTGGSRGVHAVSPDAAVAAVDAAAARVEAAVATGDAATVARVVAEAATSLPDGIRVLLGQAAVALAGEAGALDLGMLMVGAFDGTVADLPTLTGTAADQSSLAGLLVALRQVGATLGVGDATAPVVAESAAGIALDGAGVFAALASALASAASAEEGPTGRPDGAAAGPVSPVPVDAAVPAPVASAPVEATPVATAAIDTPALSDVEGVPVIAVAESGVATVIPIVAHAPAKAERASAAGADPAALAVAGAPGEGATEARPEAATTAAVPLAGAAGAGVAEGEAVDGAPVPAGGPAVSRGEAVAAGAGTVPEARTRQADATGLASAATGMSPDFEVPEQVSPVLVRLARLTGAGEAKQFTLRLAPDNLGPLSIRLTLRNGAIGVDLTAATPEARKALESALPQLRASLYDAGLRLERLDVGLRDRGDEASGRDAGRQGDQASHRQPGEPGGQAGPGTGDGGREWAATFLGRLHFDQDGRPFDLPTTEAGEAPAELAMPTREFVRVGGGETALSVTRALGVQSRVSVGLGAYGGRRAPATVAPTGAPAG